MRRIERKAEARADIKSIRERSRRMFGPGAQIAYGKLMKRAFLLLARDPQRPGVQQRDGLPAGVFLFHLRHARSRGMAPKAPRHFIVFTYDDASLTILRVLHEAMDVEGHAGEDEA
jgi:plasmid stabilization system protein ParE